MKKQLAGLLLLVGLAFSAEARKAYVETHWDDLSADEQTIKLMDGETQVGVVETSSREVGDTGDSVATAVDAVYPAEGWSTFAKRTYGCKANLSPADQVMWTDGSFRSFSETPDAQTVLGWNGSMLKRDVTTATPLFTTASDADPIFDVHNYRLEYGAIGWSGPCDGNLHYITVGVGTEGCTVEYSSDNLNWSTENIGHRDVGTHTVHYRICKGGYIPVTGSETVTITQGTISYLSRSWEGWQDGSPHSISLIVFSPSGCTIEYSLTGTDGWTTVKPTFSDAGTHVTHFRISKVGYATVTGSQTVKIRALQDFVFSATGYVGIYDGTNHGISVSVTTPASGYALKYASSEGGSYSTAEIEYCDAGTHTVWYRISATGYRTVSGCEQVVINPRPLKWPDDIEDPSHTNYTYNGLQPWHDTSRYTVQYATNYWGHGWWPVEFHGCGNYTGVCSNRFYVAKKDLSMVSGSRSRPYDGSPLTDDYVRYSGFVEGEGFESCVTIGSQTVVGYSPNDIAYVPKPNTELANYDLSVVTGRLTVTSITPVSLRQPVRMDILGTNRLTVGVQETYQPQVLYSDGVVVNLTENWSLSPDDGRINSSFSESSATLTGYPAAAGSDHVLSASFSDSYSTAATITNGLVAWYPFDGDTDDRSPLNQGLSRKSTRHVTFVKDRTETDGRALRFSDVVEGYAFSQHSAGIAQATNALSISAWVKPELYTRLGLVCRNGQFALRFRENGDWLFNDTTIACSKALTTNAWQLVTLTWDGTTASAYLDGILVGSAAMPGPLGLGSGDLLVGRTVVRDTIEAFQGSVDDLRIFDRVLTEEEISSVKDGTDVIRAPVTLSVAAAKVLAVEPQCRIPVAVDVETATGLPIGTTRFGFATGCTASGGTGWFGQYAVNSGIHDDDYDYDAAQSGKFTGAGRSWMRTTATGAGTLTFWWRTDCEQTYDYLVFRDGVNELARLSGTNDWRQMTFDLAAGAHEFRWEYVKDAKHDVGADAAWVDRMTWTPVDAPSLPPGRTSLVTAADGTSDDYVYVTWDEPLSRRAMTGYRVLRKVLGEDDGTYTNLADMVTARAFADSTAVPGVDYTYKVEALSDAGWGSCGTDDGYRRVFLTLDPPAHHFSNVSTDEFAVVTVSSNAPWKVSSDSSWLHVTVDGGQFTVTADTNSDPASRRGSVTVCAGIRPDGSTLPQAVSRTFDVTQSARVDIGFDCPSADWRTQLQVTSANDVSAYAPLSVFAADEPLHISFGWKNASDEEVVLPPVRFKVRNAGDETVLTWIDSGADVVAGRTLGKRRSIACGAWDAGNLRTLPPGDYRLEAEIDPENLLNDPSRADNVTAFRFAVRDPVLDFEKDVFSEGCWTNLVASRGDGPAQAPHAAKRTAEAPAVQFGPYVPMNGVGGPSAGRKKPVDIVFLIDYSEAMDACIAGLVNNIGNFIDRLAAGDAGRGIGPIDDLRIKIVGFGDYRSDCTYKNWMKEYAFTTDRRLLKEQLNELRCHCYGGGENGGESSYDALAYVCQGWSTVWDGGTQPTTKAVTASPFRPAAEAARVVLLFTDEPPHVPMDAPGCGKEDGVTALDVVIKAADVNLTIIGDGWYHREDPAYAANVHWLQDLVDLEPDRTKRKLLETHPRTLADFTQDSADLQALAETIVAQVPSVATLVEPSFTAVAQGEGVLTFRWCNDSTSSGTDNTLAFTSAGLTNLVRHGTTGRSWRDEEIAFGFPGRHSLRWTYRKLGYEGSVADCGLVSDVRWRRNPTELEIAPPTAELDSLGFNKVQMATQVVDTVLVPCKAFGATPGVRCNSIWKVVTNSAPEWIELVQDSGSGDGNLVLTALPNESYFQRSGTLTVRAGEYGLPDDDIVEKTVLVVQDGAEPVPTLDVQILSVEVKPRWPWSKKVDVDFRIVLPIGEPPATVTLTGLNGEGGDMVDDFPVLKQLKECPARSRVYHGFGAKQADASVDGTTKLMYVTCSTSGCYRLTWDMGADWYYAGLAALKLKDLGLGQYNLDTSRNPWEMDKFHTPAFSVRLKAACAGRADVEKQSNVVRVDMRLGDMTDTPKDPYVQTVPAGGRILTGVERIGHPYGAVDPEPYDTRDATLFPSNGWNRLDFVPLLGRAWSNRYDAACVINDEGVAIEGGEIASNAVWSTDRVHVVRDNVFVKKGASLTIEEGTVVKFCDCARLYIYEDETAAAKTAARHNLVVRGAYFTYGYDDTYRGDTLYHKNEATWWSSGQNLVYSQGTADGCAISTERVKGTEEVEDTTYPVWPEERALLRVQLKETFRNPKTGEVSTEPFKCRYYSYEQPWGVLPRPNRDDCTFYGWYTNDPKSVSAKDYRASTGIMLDESRHPYTMPLCRSVFALVCAADWAKDFGGTLWPDIDASTGLIFLDANSAVYDGALHVPEVTRLIVAGELLSSDLYETQYGPGNFVTSGTYQVGAAFRTTYTNSPLARFEILPRSVVGGEVVLSSTRALYVPDADGGVAFPSVKVLLPMGDGGEMIELPEADRAAVRTNWYDRAKDVAHYWPRPGTYHVEVSFNGNYSGTLTNEFVIEKNPEYDFCSARFARTTEAEAVEAAIRDGKRILYFGGEVPEDAATAYMKALIAEDIDLNEWVIANFVCWTDAADSAAFARYAEGLDRMSCPLVCILNPNDMDRPITRTCGYRTKEEIMDFLTASLTAPVDASTARAALRSGKETFVYNGAVQVPAPEDMIVTYAGEELASDLYDLVFEDAASENVGTYAVWARMKPDTWVGGYLVTGLTAAVSYDILPQTVSDDMSAEIRARLGLGLDPPVAVYNGSVQRPAVTSVVAYASRDYGTNDWFNVGLHTVEVTFSGNYCGTVSETFAITARVVTATVELDRWEEAVAYKATTPLRPNVLRVYDAARTYVADVDYTVDYGPGSYTVPGTNTVTVSFCGNYSGEACVSFVIRSSCDGPAIEEDPDAVVTGDAERGYVVTPSAGKNVITVLVPIGLSPSKVTVMLSPSVTVSRPNGAQLRIARGYRSYDINRNLNVSTNAVGVVDLANASVKEEVARELFDVSKGAVVDLDPSDPYLKVVTREGLLYSFREGETLELLKEDEPETHVGDDGLWELPVSVWGGPSGFYGISVEK